jgi:transglutaminase-like putative cysteine protease
VPDDADGAGSAVEAFALRRGKGRDFAHVFIACARFLGIPTRFIAGYRAADEESIGAGQHDWAEAFVPGLGWVGFDATAPICPDDRYIRVAIGFDGHDAAMTRSAHGGGEEKVETAVHVDQAGAQSQA